MKRNLYARVFLLSVVMMLAGCGSVLSTATRTIEMTSAALEPAARAGVAYHTAEVDKLTEELVVAREEMGCGTGESLPADCDKVAWKDTRDEFIGKMDAAKERYEIFKDSILTTDVAVALAADAVLAYEANKGGVDFADIIQRLIRAYQAVSMVLKDWEVRLPVLGVE